MKTKCLSFGLMSSTLIVLLLAAPYAVAQTDSMEGGDAKADSVQTNASPPEVAKQDVKKKAPAKAAAKPDSSKKDASKAEAAKPDISKPDRNGDVVQPKPGQADQEQAKPADAGSAPATPAPANAAPAAPVPSAAAPNMPASPSPAPVPAPAASSGGFFSKLMGLVGGKKDGTPAAPSSPVATAHVAPAVAPSAPVPPSTQARDIPPAAPSAAPIPPRAAVQQPPAVAPDLDTAAKNVDPKNLEIGKKIAKHFDMKEKVKGALRGPMMMVMSALRRDNPDKIDKIQKIVDGVVEKAAEKSQEEAQRNKAIFFAQTFTTDELKQLQSFFETSAGEKTINSWDQMGQRDAIFTRELMVYEMPQLRGDVLKEAKKSDIKIPKGLEQ